ncbi:MAG: hypothetical protein OHK0026_14430 [Rhodocyclaceae bacterium]
MFAGALAIAGLGIITFPFTSVAVFVLESDLDYTLRRRRMEKLIRKLSGHYIACGFGRVGRNIAQELGATHRQFVGIGSDGARLDTERERLSGLLHLAGDASDDETLEAPKVRAARGVPIRPIRAPRPRRCPASYRRAAR